MKNLISLIFLIFFVVFFTSCEWLDPDEKLPCYIKIDSVKLNVRPGEGSASHAINTVWVYVDGQRSGVYELPAKFPLLFEGSNEVIIMPGIKLNGISTTRAVYPFYDDYKVNINLSPLEEIELVPVYHYVEGIKFHFIEDFETPGSIFTSHSTSDTFMINTDDATEVFEGNFSGKISLTDDRDTAIITTINSYKLAPGLMHFLELNYKSTENLTVGIMTYTNTGPLTYPYVILKPTDIWKKIYINLSPLASRYGQNSNFIIFFATYKTSTNSEGKILLDNIKLISSE